MRMHQILAALIAAILLALSQANALEKISWAGKATKKSGGGIVNDFKSAHFLLHTDLSAKEAKELLSQMEAEQKLLAAYWGRPASGVLECYVAKDFSKWPQEMKGQLEPQGAAKIAEGAGVCTAKIAVMPNGRFSAKGRLYAVAKDNLGAQVPLHEAVHGYCLQTFGRTGPRWYAEGMAELGHYWVAGKKGVNVPERVIGYLRGASPRRIENLIVAEEGAGGDWKDYCWWWFLCSMLEGNPNYTKQFRVLGNEMLSGKNGSFQQTFSAKMKEMEFEYDLFRKHLQNGYRHDLCAIDWSRKFSPITSEANRDVSVSIQAARGWQPSGLAVSSGSSYVFQTTGTWRLAKNGEELTARGEKNGAGRLVGMIVKDYAVGEEFDLDESGGFTAKTSGNLYLRCKLPWDQIAGASGYVMVKLRGK